MFDRLGPLEDPPRSLFLLVSTLAQSDLDDELSTGSDDEPNLEDLGIGDDEPNPNLEDEPNSDLDDEPKPDVDDELDSDLNSDTAPGFRDDSQAEIPLVLETGLPSLSGGANEMEGLLSPWLTLVAEWPMVAPKRPPLT